ncbi:hypothetical protein [Yeosuana marina]|uniref:hypothetical protein n=1 Tax=Yeosuana marina TaxID=1565536 RepID=UPI00141EEE05|nr:hypothetical protein [Yeosuana marina]
MSRKNQKIIAGLLLVLLVSFGLYKNIYDHNKLTKNGIITNGKVIKLKYVNKSTYDLIFEFYADSVKIQGNVFTSYFEIKNIKGKIYKVTYSKESPEINDIDIGEYNSYKKHRPFFSN